jgi:hypothetical protein
MADRRGSRGMKRAAAIAALLCGMAAPAFAGQACNGTVQASTLQAIPNPLVVMFQPMRFDAKARQVAASFTDGLRAGGATVQPNAANVLHLTFLVGTSGGQGPAREYSNFAWTKEPAAAGDGPMTITVSAALTNRGQLTLLWVASLTCQTKTRDPQVLAEEIGQVLGGVLGKQADQKAF